MSLLTEFTKTVTIKRQSVENTDAMSDKLTYTIAARGSLPTQLDCRAMKASANERFQYGITDENATDYLLFTTDPQVDERDQIQVSATSTQPIRLLNVLTQINVQELDRLWIVSCQESSRGVK